MDAAKHTVRNAKNYIISHSLCLPLYRIFRKTASPKESLQKYYSLGEHLGSGNFADVYRAELHPRPASASAGSGQSSGRTFETGGRLLPIPKAVAVKCIHRQRASMEEVMREVEVTKLIAHPVRNEPAERSQ